MSNWAKRLDYFIDEPSQEDVDLVQKISDRYPNWVFEQQNAADPWVIAHACRRKAFVVTDERAKGPGTADRNLKIPNVAAEFQVSCINPIELARRECWRF
ncbi:DUF4411 family protein [Nocardia sp. BMG51109]|uniref:DUF4411 family protein n=1 Tax=Nocardia sp. BMG51109 TaxID=1056816 RepID=UPI0004BA1322|nr:DUF4411 family protein [Nocardia sp. BMG51109]